MVSRLIYGLRYELLEDNVSPKDLHPKRNEYQRQSPGIDTRWRQSAKYPGKLEIWGCTDYARKRRQRIESKKNPNNATNLESMSPSNIHKITKEDALKLFGKK